MIGTMPRRRISDMIGSSCDQSYLPGPGPDLVDGRAVAEVAQAQLADELEVGLPHLVVAGVAELVDADCSPSMVGQEHSMPTANMKRSESTGIGDADGGDGGGFAGHGGSVSHEVRVIGNGENRIDHEVTKSTKRSSLDICIRHAIRHRVDRDIFVLSWLRG